MSDHKEIVSSVAKLYVPHGSLVNGITWLLWISAFKFAHYDIEALAGTGDKKKELKL